MMNTEVAEEWRTIPGYEGLYQGASYAELARRHNVSARTMSLAMRGLSWKGSKK